MTAVVEAPVARETIADASLDERSLTDASVAEAAAAASVTDGVRDRIAPADPAADVPIVVPDDADAPPEDDEPPFDPGPPAEEVVSTASRMPTKRSAPSTGGFQRYGEAVVREVLGATFLEEIEAPGRSGFGERG